MRCLKADMKKGEGVCARGAAAGCQGVILQARAIEVELVQATLTNELCMDSAHILY